jgi:hypothetical protein
VALISDCAILRDGLRVQLASAGAEVLEAETLESLSSGAGSPGLLLVDARLTDKEPLPDVNSVGIPAVALLLR